MLFRHLTGAVRLSLLPLLAGFASSADAAVCNRVNQPGATLLFPYFEVDLSDPNGRSTMISINNAGNDPVLAHVVLWTNWGIPTLAFDIYLTTDGVQTLNLRRLFSDGVLPETSPPPIGGGMFQSCARPIALPDLSGDALGDLWARHTGQTVPFDSTCYSAPQDPSLSLAVGYITVDAMNDCSETIQLHADEGYFDHEGTGLASNRNVLWGDFFLVDPSQDYAQGNEAVSIMADAARFGPDSPEPTFYVEEILSKSDNRAPLSHTYRSRFLNGGGFDGGTELILWHAGFCVPIGTLVCGGSPLPPELNQELVLTFRDERGEAIGESLRQELTLRMTRIRVGAEGLPEDALFGQVEMRVDGEYEGAPSPRDPAQAWVIPILSAESRYSLSLNALQVDGACQDPVEQARSRPDKAPSSF